MSKTIKDPYAELGVKPTATDAEIKKAFRALAKKLHPDINVGDDASRERFKAISAAYSFLTDKEKKRRYDAGEIDASGAEKPDRNFYKDFSSSGPRHRYEPEGSFDGFGDIFSRAFGGGGGGARFGAGQGPSIRMRGGDLRFHLTIGFRDAITGSKQQVMPPNGSKIEVTIPAGIKEGQTLRLAGRGQPGVNGGPAGDALIEIAVAADPIFTRDGDDILLDLPISIDEAVLGASVEVPTVKGRVKLRIPAGSSSGRVMRIKGRGAPSGKGITGDQLVSLKIVLPERISDTLKNAMEDLRKSGGYNARAGWKGETK